MRINFRNHIYLVTNRCEEERFFLLPRPGLQKLIGAWLSKALREHGKGIEIYAFIFVSNHFHFLLRDPEGKLAEFMWYFQLNLAKAVNRFNDKKRRGHFFSKEYDAAPVITDKDFENCYAYIVTNAVKAGLVAKATDGPFFSSLDAALNERALEFKWLDRTRLHNKTRRGQRVQKSDFEKDYSVNISIPPMWRHFSKMKRKLRIIELVKNSESRYGKERRAEGRTVFGVHRIRNQTWKMRPKNPERRPRSKVICHIKELRDDYINAIRITAGRYREVYDGFLKACKRGRRIHLEWPTGCYPPSSMVPVLPSPKP